MTYSRKRDIWRKGTRRDAGGHRSIDVKVKVHTECVSVCIFTLGAVRDRRPFNFERSMYLLSAPALGPTVRPWYGDEYEASLSMSGCQ